MNCIPPIDVQNELLITNIASTLVGRSNFCTNWFVSSDWRFWCTVWPWVKIWCSVFSLVISLLFIKEVDKTNLERNFAISPRYTFSCPIYVYSSNDVIVMLNYVSQVPHSHPECHLCHEFLLNQWSYFMNKIGRCVFNLQYTGRAPYNAKRLLFIAF